MIILLNDRNLIPTCLYTELAKCYFWLGLFMADENTPWTCTICEQEFGAYTLCECGECKA